MIATRSIHVNQTKTLQSILYLGCAIGDTFVFLAIVGIGRNALCHCDINGKILYEFKSQHSVDSFAMPNKSEAIKQIILISTVTRIKATIMNLCMKKQARARCSLSVSLDIFVQEKGCYIDNRLHLTYYKNPLSVKLQPVIYFHSKDDQWISDMEIFNADNHSLFVWCKLRQDNEIDVRSVDLRYNPQGEFKHFRQKNNLGSIYNLPLVEIGIKNIFEIRPNQLFLVCFSSKNVSRAVNKNGLVNNNFILNIQSPHSPYIFQSRFYFKGNWNERLIDCFSIGAYSIFHTYDSNCSQALSSPVFFLNFKGQLIFSQSWRCTYRTKFFVPGYSDNSFFEAQYENGHIKEFAIHQKTVLNPNASLRQKLKQLYEDFDEVLQIDVFDFLQFR